MSTWAFYFCWLLLLPACLLTFFGFSTFWLLLGLALSVGFPWGRGWITLPPGVADLGVCYKLKFVANLWPLYVHFFFRSFWHQTDSVDMNPKPTWWQVAVMNSQRRLFPKEPRNMCKYCSLPPLLVHFSCSSSQRIEFQCARVYAGVLVSCLLFSCAFSISIENES